MEAPARSGDGSGWDHAQLEDGDNPLSDGVGSRMSIETLPRSSATRVAAGVHACPSGMRFWKFRPSGMKARAWTPVPTWTLLVLSLLLTSCAHKPAQDTLVMIIE